MLLRLRVEEWGLRSHGALKMPKKQFDHVRQLKYIFKSRLLLQPTLPRNGLCFDKRRFSGRVPLPGPTMASPGHIAASPSAWNTLKSSSLWPDAAPRWTPLNAHSLSWCSLTAGVWALTFRTWLISPKCCCLKPALPCSQVDFVPFRMAVSSWVNPEPNLPFLHPVTWPAAPRPPRTGAEEGDVGFPLQSRIHHCSRACGAMSQAFLSCSRRQMTIPQTSLISPMPFCGYKPHPLTLHCTYLSQKRNCPFMWQWKMNAGVGQNVEREREKEREKKRKKEWKKEGGKWEN